MGLATALAVGGLAVTAGSAIANGVSQANQASDAQKAQNAQLALQAQNQQAAQQSAQDLNAQTQAQQSLANNLADQKGIAKQNNAYSADASLAGQQGSLAQQQQGLVGQLQGVANGTGPNPAQEMLKQATNQNIQQAAGTVSSTKGLNPALAARLAGQNATSALQNSAGQGATLQAQQSLGALGQIGSQQSAIGNTLSQQGNTINNQAGIGNQQVANQMAAQNSATSAAATQAGLANGLALGQQNANNSAQGINNQQGQFNSNQTTKAVGGLASGLGAASQMFASGGEVGNGPRSFVTHHMSGNNPMPQAKMAQGGAVPAMVSPGEVYLAPSKVQAVARGADPIKAGEKIPGKAKVKGNSLKNDIVPKTLQEGGIVLPKSVMESNNPHWEAHKFVSAIMKEKALKGKK